MRGSCESALAIITRRFMPPESSMIFASRFSQSARSRSRRSTWAGLAGLPNSARLKDTVLQTVENMSSAISCGTSPILRRVTR